MSDRIGIMNSGRIEQIGTPKELYEMPENDFVASFLGESNIFCGRYVEVTEGRAQIEIESLKTAIKGETNSKISPGEEAVALVRPEAVRVVGDPDLGISGKLEEVVYLGELAALKVKLSNGQDVWSRRLAKDGYPMTEHVGLVWNPEDVLLLPLASKTPNREEEKK